jgi:Sulfatase
MHQKWHQAYEETVHVPFIVHNPTIFSGRNTIDTLTSHADVIPTMLGLAGLNPARLRRQIAATHDETHPLVGRDLSGLVLGERDPATVNDPVYFMTDDEVSRGSEQVDFTQHMYPSVIQPNHLETVVAYPPTGRLATREKWKYTRYFDTEQFWSQPPDEPPPGHLPPEDEPEGVDMVTLIEGNVEEAGSKQPETTVKTVPVPDQIEVYYATRSWRTLAISLRGVEGSWQSSGRNATRTDVCRPAERAPPPLRTAVQSTVARPGSSGNERSPREGRM